MEGAAQLIVVLFEDPQVAHLYPITLGRAAYAITCGSYRLIDLVARIAQRTHGVVRPHLEVLQRIDSPALSERLPERDESIVLLNARAVPSIASLARLETWLQDSTPARAMHQGALLAARLPASSALREACLSVEALHKYCAGEAFSRLPERPLELPLFSLPHDVVKHNMGLLNSSLDDRLQNHAYQEIADGVFAAAGAELSEYIVTRTIDGPIILDEHVKVGPYCYLSGPAYLGPATKVLEHSSIKDAVSVGGTCKIGGEVEASVIESYSNKQHHGFLGHSYLGSWINLGAGTCNSDLKNTYGTVKMDYRGESVATDMQFLGCIMGDYAKTAINTGIFTGKIIGTCSMVYGFVTTNVPSYVNYARLFGQVTELPPEVMIATQRRMFARRQVEQRPCDIQLLHDMYELTHHERQLAGEPLAL